MHKIGLFFSLVFIIALPLSSAGAVTLPDRNLIREEVRELRKDMQDMRKNMREEFRSDTILVKFRNTDRAVRIPVPAFLSPEQVVLLYGARGDVEYAEPDYVAYAFYIPNDTYYQYQWNLGGGVSGHINTESAWNISNGSGVTIAVIDTGVAYENYSDGTGRYYQAPDFSGTRFVAGYDFVNNDSHPNDDNGHGTHVAGTVAESTGNNEGVAGVAHGAQIMPVKALDSRGRGSYSDIADAIRFAADHGADVINLSLGGSSNSRTLEDAVSYAYGKGVVIVAAAGNNGRSSVSYPARYDDYVIAVGATRYDERRASYSNYGSSLDIMAPGGDTRVDQNGDGYGDGILQQTFSGTTGNFGYYFYQGTSMAAPHVAGVAALVISNGNATTPSSVRAALESTAKDLGPAGRDNGFGHGLVNAYEALQWSNGPSEEAASEPEPAPETTPEPAPDPEPESTPEPSKQTMHIESITFATKNFVSRCRVYAYITVRDHNGDPVSRADVDIVWSGGYERTDDDDTDSRGTVEFRTRLVECGNPITLKVLNVSKDGWQYNAEADRETSDTIVP
jgi:serine protease